MKRFAGIGIVLAAIMLLAAGAARSGRSASARAATGDGQVLAVVRATTGLCGASAGAPLGPPSLFAVFPPPVLVCPAPAQCATATTGPTSKKHPKPPQPPACPKPRPNAIYLVGADGLSPHWFAAGIEPAWSPDGTEIAFTTGRFLTIQGVAGNPPRDVIVAMPEALAPTIDSPSWSADGKQIVFSVTQTDSTLTGSEWREQLYSVNVATVDVSQLTADLAGESDHSPAYSPDGSTIAYAHWGPQPGIWLINADDTNARQIVALDGYPSGLSWSPDGRSIAFALREQHYGNAEIDVVGADGSNLHRVATTNDDFLLDRPTWSPEGQQIEFTANNANGTRVLYAVHPDGTDLHLALTEPWSLFEPTWEPKPPSS
jgi:dipeptidyl aminopeptidase/acylaminoacyl peptidase